MKKLLTVVAVLAGIVICADAHAQNDWAGFSRFEQANREQPSAPKAVFMGNSITEGWIGKHPGFFSSNGYVSRGISGQTTSQMLVRFRADVIDLHPQVVVICGGTNDIAQNNGYISLPHIFGNIVSMVELARANGIAPILCSLLPARDFGWHKGLEPAPKIIELNRMIRAYAAQEKIPYVDYHTPMAEPDGGMIAAYTGDGVHPTEAGYDVMEAIVQPVIGAALKHTGSKRHK